MIRQLTLALIIVAAPAAAQTPAVDAARAVGGVGERYDGYLGIAGPVAPAVRSQVSRINIQRRALYSNLGSQKGASPQEVGVTAGCQLLARVGVGQAYLLADGVWRRRAAGQPAPVPDYCR
ncbi:YdbL family protein [Sphingomonas sp. URHD0057]|uniref:YdbL family protein n=1 Tax=Sphingomonas sp. URHD0057 TaxID=1380389 RepID=UPI00048B3B2A|nr:YdbL family protein [Sphingomonas sp. URHD0057]